MPIKLPLSDNFKFEILQHIQTEIGDNNTIINCAALVCRSIVASEMQYCNVWTIEIREANYIGPTRNTVRDNIPRIWVWTTTEDYPSLVVELSDPTSFRQVVEHIQNYTGNKYG